MSGMKYKRKISLRVKSICFVLFMALALGIAAATISYEIYAETMDRHYSTITLNLAKTAAITVSHEKIACLTREVMDIYRQICDENGGVVDFDSFDEKDWEAYYSRYESIVNTEEFKATIEKLYDISDVNNVLSMYICYMDDVTGKAVYIVDGTVSGSSCLPGTCDDIEKGNREIMKQGIYEFPAYITNYEEYGWICSASSGIYDENGNIIANAYVDISMDEVMRDRQMFLVRLGAILAAVTCLLILLLLYAVDKTVLSHVKAMAYAAMAFISEKEEHRGGADKFNSAITKLDIHTGDEIEELSVAIKEMEAEINAYIENLTSVTAEKERIGAELNVATQIQANMLPNIFPAFPEYDEFDIYATMTPAKEVGGDFYDLFMVDSTHIAIVMADVSGKGVPAALFMVIAKTLIKNHAQNQESPAQIFTNVNSQLCENNEVGMFVTGWIGIMDIHTGQMLYANAGHNYPIIIRKNGEIEWVKSRPGFVLAGMDGVKYRQNELQLNEGDIIYLYTDGVTEALDINQELYGDERLKKALSKEDIRHMRPADLLKRVSEELSRFTKGAEQADDITMLALKRSCNEEAEEKFQRKLSIPANTGNWNEVSLMLEEELEKLECPLGIQTGILIAAEEIFVNIASYAYGDGGGTADIYTDIDEQGYFKMVFEDRGVPYNPLEKNDPDISLNAEERGVGGLGIYMVKKSMDNMHYTYRNGKNRLTVLKKIK